MASGYYADAAKRFGYTVERVMSDVWLPSKRDAYMQECKSFLMSIVRGVVFLAVMIAVACVAYLAYQEFPDRIALFILLPVSAICIVWLYRIVFSFRFFESSTLAFGDHFLSARLYRKTLCSLLQSAEPERMWVNSTGELCAQLVNGQIIKVKIVSDHSTEGPSVAVASLRILLARTREQGRLPNKVLKQRYGSFGPVKEASQKLLVQYLIAERGLLYYVIEAPIYKDGILLKKVFEIALRVGQECGSSRR